MISDGGMGIGTGKESFPISVSKSLVFIILEFLAPFEKQAEIKTTKVSQKITEKTRRI
jgi:hypothetical protein